MFLRGNSRGHVTIFDLTTPHDEVYIRFIFMCGYSYCQKGFSHKITTVKNKWRSLFYFQAKRYLQRQHMDSQSVVSHRWSMLFAQSYSEGYYGEERIYNIGSCSYLCKIIITININLILVSKKHENQESGEFQDCKEACLFRSQKSEKICLMTLYVDTYLEISKKTLFIR